MSLKMVPAIMYAEFVKITLRQGQHTLDSHRSSSPCEDAAVLVHGPVQVVLHRLLQVTCCNVLRFDGKFGQETEVFRGGFSNAVGTRTDCATTHVREACKLWYTQHFRNDIVL